MKAILIDIAIGIFCILGIFTAFAVLCYLINPENITRVSISTWAVTAVIDTVMLYVWREESR